MFLEKIIIDSLWSSELRNSFEVFFPNLEDENLISEDSEGNKFIAIYLFPERRRIYACHIEFLGLPNGSAEKLWQVFSPKLEKRPEKSFKARVS